VALFEEFPDTVDQEHILILSAQKGDRQAFAVLVERYWDRLYRWLYHLTHHRHTAEDLAQEALLKAFAHLSQFQLHRDKPEPVNRLRSGSAPAAAERSTTGAAGNFQAWLFRIAYNSFVNQWRSDGRARQAFPRRLPALEEGPVDQVLSREMLQLLARAVGRLPSEFRAAFLLRAEQGLSFHEIAHVLGIKEETARWRVFKARQKLMKVLAPELNREEV
jgi:RNA polymerase sigma-70 factor (ECF subfamily)